MRKRIPNVLSIAGSDPSGGAGIQADLKVFSALGCYGATVITALTVQNTNGVVRIHPAEAAVVHQQLESLFADIHFDAVKIGALVNESIVKEVASTLRRYKPERVVLDPVMVSKSGHPLLVPEATEALKNELIPLADLVTPNIPEAARLLGGDGIVELAKSEEEMVRQGLNVKIKYS